MNTKLIKRHVKCRTNGGDDSSYDTTIVSFKNIKIRKCGCGGVPVIKQSQNGKEYYDYAGEHFLVRCPVCGILIPGKDISGADTTLSRFNRAVIKYMPIIVNKWNKSMSNNALVSIEFKTES